jgi:hypothetical protein
MTPIINSAKNVPQLGKESNLVRRLRAKNSLGERKLGKIR